MWRWCAAGLLFAMLGCEYPAPQPAPTRLPQRVRRLSVREYTRTMRALTGVDVSVNRFLGDSLDTEYDDGPVSLDVQPEQAAVYEELAWEIAAHATRDHFVGDCVPAVDPAGCRQRFFDGFARRALRRPLSDDERQRYGALFDQTLAGGTFDEALETVAAALLQSPGFLYRAELGEKLDPFARAAALSYALTGLPPDDELLAAAAAPTLDVRAQARRLLATDEAREQLRHFADEWMGTWSLQWVRKDSAFYDLSSLGRPMRAELDRFYEYVLFDSPERSLAELFGSDVSFVDAALATHYGVALDQPPPDGNPVQVALDADTRRGVLTRAGFLTVHSGFDSSNPIARGVFVRTAILCAPPPAPPAGIPRAPGDPPTMHTTRARYDAHTALPFCQSCHAAIDGVGFGFEQFDGIGALRTVENGDPVDTSGNLIGTDVDGPFVGASQLSSRLRSSRQVADCMVRQLFRYTTGAAEQPDDELFLKAMTDHVDAHTPITDVVVDVLASPRFNWREAAP